MEENNQAMEPPREVPARVASYGLLYITRAHNRKEITFEEWLELSRAWADKVIREYDKQ